MASKKMNGGVALARAIFVGLAASVSASAAANAQTSNTFSGNLQTVSAADVSAMLSEFAITSELRASQTQGAPAVLIAQTGGGARFLVSFAQCAGPAQATGCRQATITTAQSSAGIAYDDLNSFNGQSTVTRVVYEPSQQMLIFGRNIFMPGGVGRDNFKLQIALFLQDMGGFAQSRATAGTAVSFNRTPSLKGKIDGLAASSSAGVGFGSADRAIRDLEVEIAISNATGVTFDFENSPLD
ncbi:MAG: hypothetical protein AAFX08_06295 [Pseudomonadota bacterium]